MTVTHLSLVNQKLAYASATLRLLKSVEQEQSGAMRLQVQALLDATTFHLVTAYRFYLRELAENYRVKNLVAINYTEQLIDALVTSGKDAGEATELVTMERDAESWLAQLLAYANHLQSSPVKPKEKKSFPVAGLIQVMNVTDEQEDLFIPLDISMLELIVKSFRELIQRQRQTSAEY